MFSQFMSLFGGQGQGQGQPMQLPSQVGGLNGIGNIGGAPGAAGNSFNTGFGANIGTGQLALGGLQTLGNLWTAWNANQLAQKSFDFNKTLASDNYTNQSTSYNTNLNDIASARAKMENQTPGQEQAYVSANQLKTTV
jgi:hypothetical protein